MEILYERCAGLDVHKKNVKTCFASPAEGGTRKKETRTYLTMTQNLLEMRDWLKEQGCTHIAMEATGVYWKPIYNLLEGDFEVLESTLIISKRCPDARRTSKMRSGSPIYSLMDCSPPVLSFRLPSEN